MQKSLKLGRIKLKRTVSKQNSASSWNANTNIEGETLKKTFNKI